MMNSMLIEGVQLWVYRWELQAFFPAILRERGERAAAHQN